MEVLSLCPFRAVGLVWQPRPSAYSLLLVCKGTFDLAPGVARLAEIQDYPNEEDNHWDDDANRSLYSATDLVPSKPRADVLLVGHAFAPYGQEVESFVTRLVVGDVAKAVEVVAERAWTAEPRVRYGSRITKAKLRYERAAGGEGTWNPVGVPNDAPADAFGMMPLPALQPPGFMLVRRDQRVPPVGYGPLAPGWPVRAGKLGRHAATFNAARWHAAPVPSDLDPAYFNAAQEDQQLAELRADERIELENLHPDVPHLVTTLPGLKPRVFVERPSKPPEEVLMRCDTLWIDTDRQIATLTWRGQIALAARDEAGRALVAMEPPGRTLSFIDIDRLLGRPTGPSQPEDSGESEIEWIEPEDSGVSDRPSGLGLVIPGENTSHALAVAVSEIATPEAIAAFMSGPARATAMMGTVARSTVLGLGPTPADLARAANASALKAQQVKGDTEGAHTPEASEAPVAVAFSPSSTAPLGTAVAASVASAIAATSAALASVGAGATLASAGAGGAPEGAAITSAVATTTAVGSATTSAMEAQSPSPAGVSGAPPASPPIAAPAQASPPIAATAPAPASPPPPPAAAPATATTPGVGAAMSAPLQQVVAKSVSIATAIPEPSETPIPGSAGPAAPLPIGLSATETPIENVSKTPSNAPPAARGSSPRRFPSSPPGDPDKEFPTEEKLLRAAPREGVHILWFDADADAVASRLGGTEGSARTALISPSRAPSVPRSLTASLEAAIGPDGRFEPPSVTLTGDLSLTLAPIERLRALLTVAAVIEPGDERAAQLRQKGERLLAGPSPEGASWLAGRLADDLEAALAARAGAPDSLAGARRALHAARAYTRALVLGGKQVRGLLRDAGGATLAVYISEDACVHLPLDERFRARVVGELYPRVDATDPAPFALRIAGIARIVTLLR